MCTFAILLLICITLVSSSSSSSVHGSNTNSPKFVHMGSLSNYAVLAGATITNSGISTVSGDVGLFPGDEMTVSATLQDVLFL